MMFSKETIKYLCEAGWSENYKIKDIEFVKDKLRAAGFAIPNKVAVFLNHFGNIRVENNSDDSFHFNAPEAIGNVDPDWVIEDYSARVRDKLCIIGEAFNGYMVLCMSSAGEVYAGFDNTLVYVGASGEEAIDKLCLGRKLVKVPEANPEVSAELKDSINNRSLINEIKNQLKDINDLSGKDEEIIRLLEKGWQNYYRGKEKKSVLIPTLCNSTKECLNDMLDSKISLSFDGIIFFWGVHPKKGMKKAEIKKYIMNIAKNRGFFVGGNSIETKYIPETKYAVTVFHRSYA